MKVSIIDYGACHDGSLCTKAIQSAIDACFLSGGGTVEVPSGTFLTGGIRLRSNITLMLKSGAVLLGSRDSDDYTDILTDKIEPVDEAFRSDCLWTPALSRESFDFINKPLSRWNSGLIRAINAENVAVIGENGSFIDGADCFDERGEEHYRGPHGVNMHFCRNIRFSGYTARNTGNWAHALFNCQDITVENVTVLAGHDGVHMTSCDGARIENCEFYTGDDCVAGIDNTDITVKNCLMNTACSAFRMGGAGIRISGCRMYGPAKYLFRGSLTPEEKRSGKPTQETTHRYNMLSAFTYYADFSRSIRHRPGDIVMEDCTVENVDRFLHYNFSGNEPWQRNRPLKDITFRNITAEGLRFPLTAYGEQGTPVSLRIENCSFGLADGTEGMSFMHLCHFDDVTLKNIQVHGLINAPLIRRWSDGVPTTENLTWDDSANPFIRDAEFEFNCRPI